MMHGLEKSDSAIVALKPANKGGPPAAEWVEPRVGTEGNAGQPHTRRAQRLRVFRARPSSAHERRPVQAQSAAIARAMASICYDERASLGEMSGHERKTLRLSEPQ